MLHALQEPDEGTGKSDHAIRIFGLYRALLSLGVSLDERAPSPPGTG